MFFFKAEKKGQLFELIMENNGIFFLSLNSAPPVPSEDIDKHRRRFNMRMLVPGRPAKGHYPTTCACRKTILQKKSLFLRAQYVGLFCCKGKGLRNAFCMCVCLHHMRNDGGSFWVESPQFRQFISQLQKLNNHSEMIRHLIWLR